MLGMNLWGTIYNMVYMFGLPHRSGFEAVQFCKQHPEAAWDILMYCLCGAVGQNFIFLTISRFGSLANTTITTTRKFVSIVVSSVLSGNPLSTKQWGCVSMVFGGLSYQIYLKWRKLQRVQKKKKTWSWEKGLKFFPKIAFWFENFLLRNITPRGLKLREKKSLVTLAKM